MHFNGQIGLHLKGGRFGVFGHPLPKSTIDNDCQLLTQERASDSVQLQAVFICGGLVVPGGGVFYKCDKCISATASVETMKCFQCL